MRSISEIVEGLNKILESKESVRAELIKSIQAEIWNDESIKEEILNQLLSELAYDLDFYEPNGELRRESGSYYGDERLEEVIKLVLQKLKPYG